MSNYTTKVFVVQQADAFGALGEVLAVKHAHVSAHAKRHAPGSGRVYGVGLGLRWVYGDTCMLGF